MLKDLISIHFSFLRASPSLRTTCISLTSSTFHTHSLSFFFPLSSFSLLTTFDSSRREKESSRSKVRQAETKTKKKARRRKGMTVTRKRRRRGKRERERELIVEVSIDHQKKKKKKRKKKKKETTFPTLSYPSFPHSTVLTVKTSTSIQLPANYYFSPFKSLTHTITHTQKNENQNLFIGQTINQSINQSSLSLLCLSVFVLCR